VAKFVLHPHKLRADKFVPVKDAEELTLDWPKLKALLAPSGEFPALRNLRNMQVSGFVGTMKDANVPGKVNNFFFLNVDRSANVAWLLKRDPTFEKRLLSAYWVREAAWDSKMEEHATPHPDLTKESIRPRVAEFSRQRARR
jgi:hypothetical protein